jgi:hypothetical protein
LARDLLRAFDCALRPLPRVGGSAGSLARARLDRIGTRHHLFGSPAFCGDGVSWVTSFWVIEVELLLVKHSLMLIACALGVVKHILGCPPPGLREGTLRLPACSVVLPGGAIRAGVGVLVQQGLCLIEALLVAVTDRLLPVAERLFETGDPLVCVELLL